MFRLYFNWHIVESAISLYLCVFTHGCNMVIFYAEKYIEYTLILK